MTDRATIRGISFLLVLMLICGLRVSAQELPESGGDSKSVQFQTAIPVSLRKSNGSLMRGFLIGISESSVTFRNAQGRTFEFQNDTVKSVRSADGSVMYSPGKDNAAEVIQQMRTQQATTGSNGAVPNTGPGQVNPGGAHGTSPMPNGSLPFTPIQTPPNPNAGAHGQPRGNGAIPFMPIPSQPNPSAGHSPMPSHNMPMPSHNAPMPSHNTPMSSHVTMPPTMPAQPHMQMPGVMPQTQIMHQYQCMKCRHIVTSPVELQAGHRCTHCGTVWGQVQDQSGRVVSSSPVAAVGGGVGVVVVIIGIIAAIVRKSQSA
jgi:hypothetical protein